MVIAIYSSWPRADGDGESDGWGRIYALSAALIDAFGQSD
jgi:hypothetical protein